MDPDYTAYIHIIYKKRLQKSAYIRDSVDPFRYTIANIYKNFRFGSPSLWEMCDRISKDSKTCDFENDPLLSAFKIDL